MPKLIVTLILAVVLAVPVLGQSFYDVDSVRTLQLVFAQSNWDQILDSLYLAGFEERLLGTLYIDGVQYDSVGVRYKGNSTFNPNQVKNPFNIKLDYIKDDQLIQGYGTLKLANGRMIRPRVRRRSNTAWALRRIPTQTKLVWEGMGFRPMAVSP